MKNTYLITGLLLCSVQTFANTSELKPYPVALNKLPQQEFGQLVYKLMPQKNQKNIFWDFKSNDRSIIWLDKTYIERKLPDGTIHSDRKGIARVNVLGVKSTYLNYEKYELPWTVMMEGGLGKFGPNRINIYPATASRNNEETCFGDNFDNCEFSPFKSLAKANIKYRKICEEDNGAVNFEKAYLLTSPNKEPLIGIWQSSGGSGGTSNQFVLDYTKDPETLCKNYMK